MKERRTKRGIRALRLCAIRHRLGLTVKEFARQLGLHEIRVKHIEAGIVKCPLTPLLLAEMLLTEYLKKEKDLHAVTKLKPVAIPKEYSENEALKTKVITDYCAGMSEPELATKYILRPEIVAYYLANVTD